MFDANDMKWLDPKYFVIISSSDYDVTVMTRNTGHYWYIHDPDCQERQMLALFHRHHGGSEPYHFQRHEPTVRQAVRYIRKHDRFQMNGRKW
jgi:hypothetical protein